jgi:alkanesulfonate monooxygenase
MAIEFIGMIASEAKSEIHPATRPVIDPGYIARFAQAHEAAGFDRVLIAHNSTDGDAVLVATHAAQHTKTLGFMIAHRPGFIAPTYAARLFATFDVFSGGRGGIHIISGGSSEEQRRDGDFLDHEERYRRTDEYVGLMRRTWTAEAPFSHEGPYYKVENAFARVKPVQKPHIPIYFGGSSDLAIAFAAKHADIYAFWGETLEMARDTIVRVRAACARIGRNPDGIRFSLSMRPVLAATEEAAWQRADRIIERIRDLRGDTFGKANPRPESIGSKRLLEAASGGKVRDKRLWTEVAAAVGAGSNTTSLVGTPEQVAESLLEYHALGVTTFLIRGFDPLDDATDFGRALLPLVRAGAEPAPRSAAAA